MIAHSAGERIRGRVLEDGCGIGMYAEKLAALHGRMIGLEFDFPRAREARLRTRAVVNAASECLPLRSGEFDLVLSHEVIEHVRDDAAAVREMVRVLGPGGRAVIFCPNRGYPFETHGIYWRGRYHFGNVPLVNYLPRAWRDRLAPHVRAYTARDLERLVENLPVRLVERTIIFGAYDNLIARFGVLGKALRAALRSLERTPLRAFGLSHYWVIERIPERGTRGGHEHYHSSAGGVLD
jgi:SAM-dependent methyltransferase